MIVGAGRPVLLGLVPVPATADFPTRCSGDGQNSTDDDREDSESPDDRDFRDEADDQQDNSQDDHDNLLLMHGPCGVSEMSLPRREVDLTAVFERLILGMDFPTR
ncbi:MAG: hypothetical protein JWO57_3675 [Pseudonocardiales bacterium]|nr:hypothetical protein [Pseudonocardiales bacterium]